MLWRVSNEWQRVMRDALAEYELSHVQFVLLASTVWLEDQNIKVSQAAIVRQTAIDKMMVSDVTKTLESKGFVKRHKDPQDGRAQVLTATPIGEKTLRGAMKAVEKANRSFFGRSHFGQDTIVELLQSLSTFDRE